MKRFLFLLLLPIAAQSQVTSTRVTPYDWQCQDVAGVRISDHARFDTAFVACINSPNGALIKGGTYRIGKTAQPPPPLLGSADITWTSATLNTDGSPMKPIIRHELEYSLDPINFVQRVNITAGNTYTVPGLSVGLWYFRMRTVTEDGVSAWTNLASKAI